MSIALTPETANLVFAAAILIVSVGTLLFMRREVRRVRARYFARHGHYPGEPAPNQAPAE